MFMLFSSPLPLPPLPSKGLRAIDGVGIFFSTRCALRGKWSAKKKFSLVLLAQACSQAASNPNLKSISNLKQSIKTFFISLLIKN
jgi:hypothetical protein